MRGWFFIKVALGFSLIRCDRAIEVRFTPKPLPTIIEPRSFNDCGKVLGCIMLQLLKRTLDTKDCYRELCI